MKRLIPLLALFSLFPAEEVNGRTMPCFVAFSAPDPAADYACSVVDLATGNSFSVAKAGFAPNAPDELIRMVRDLSPNRSAMRYAMIPVTLIPPSPGQYLVSVHPAAGGQPVGNPFPVVSGLAAARQIAAAFTM